MKYQPPVGGAANDPYVTGIPGSLAGSIPSGPAIEYPQREILAVIQAASLTPDDNDLTQLLKAIRMLGFGYDQAPVDVSASRAINTNYLNSTSKPILVSAGGQVLAGTGFYTLYIGLAPDFIPFISTNVQSGFSFSLTTLVLPGFSYNLSKGGSDTFSSLVWRELR